MISWDNDVSSSCLEEKLEGVAANNGMIVPTVEATPMMMAKPKPTPSASTPNPKVTAPTPQAEPKIPMESNDAAVEPA